MKRVLTLWFAALFAATTGCSPVSVSFTLFGDNARLHEVEVDTDKAAGDAKVVIIDVRGLISDDIEAGLLGRERSTVDHVAAHLKKAAQDSSVKAVIVRINSPGGTVTASDMI